MAARWRGAKIKKFWCAAARRRRRRCRRCRHRRVPPQRLRFIGLWRAGRALRPSAALNVACNAATCNYLQLASLAQLMTWTSTTMHVSATFSWSLPSPALRALWPQLWQLRFDARTRDVCAISAIKRRIFICNPPHHPISTSIYARAAFNWIFRHLFHRKFPNLWMKRTNSVFFIFHFDFRRNRWNKSKRATRHIKVQHLSFELAQEMNQMNQWITAQ